MIAILVFAIVFGFWVDCQECLLARARSLSHAHTHSHSNHSLALTLLSMVVVWHCTVGFNGCC